MFLVPFSNLTLPNDSSCHRLPPAAKLLRANDLLLPLSTIWVINTQSYLPQCLPAPSTLPTKFYSNQGTLLEARAYLRDGRRLFRAELGILHGTLSVATAFCSPLSSFGMSVSTYQKSIQAEC